MAPNTILSSYFHVQFIVYEYSFKKMELIAQNWWITSHKAFLFICFFALVYKESCVEAPMASF